MKEKWILPLIVIIIMAFSICAGCLKEDDSNDNGEDDRGMVKITDVRVEPQDPEPGENITVTATIENCSLAHIQVGNYFGSGGGPSGYLPKVGKNIYESGIGSFENGTELWIMIGATGWNNSFVVSQEITMYVGQVERSNITSLSIANVSYSPLQPTIENDSVMVTANITSNKTISRMGLEHIRFFPQGSGGGGGSGSGPGLNQTNFEQEISFRGAFDSKWDEESIVFFRVWANDDSGNTVVSLTRSFSLSQKMP